MRRVLLLSLVSSASGLVAADSSATDYWVRVMPAAWVDVRLKGDLAYQGSSGEEATEVTPSTLGLDQSRTVPQLELGAQIPFLFSFAAGYDRFADSGSGTLSQTVTFGSHSYTAGTTINSTVTLRDYWGEIGVRPFNLDRVGVGIGIAVHDVQGDIGLNDPQLGVSDTLEKSIPIPALSLRAHVRPIGSLTIEGRLHGIDAGYEGNHLKYADLELQADYRPIPFVGVIGGYHYTLYDIRLHDPTGSGSTGLFDVHLGGPYVGLIAEF